MNCLSQWAKSWWCRRHHWQSWGILHIVCAQHKHGDISGRGRDDFCVFTFQVSCRFLQGSEDSSGLQNILSINITLFDISRISQWKMKIRFNSWQVSYFQSWLYMKCPWVDILESVDQVVEVKKAVIDGDHIYLAEVSPDDQVPNTAKSIYLNLHHHISGTWLALHEEMYLSVKWEGSEIQDHGAMKMLLEMTHLGTGHWGKGAMSDLHYLLWELIATCSCF